MVKKLDAKFKYNFQIVNFYLVQPTKGPNFLMSSKKKQNPDK